MKKYILFLFFVPLLAFAGGSHYSPPPVCALPIVPPPVVTPPVIPPIVTPAPPIQPPIITPTVPHNPPGGGGGMIYCSGPLAPGWHTDIPGGGCNTVCTPITNFKVENWVKGDGKVQLLWQGSGYVNVWKKEKGVISHWYMKSSGFFEVPTQGGDFWLSNACSTTAKIDP